jgi:PAS domain S-box-containing protein
MQYRCIIKPIKEYINKMRKWVVSVLVLVSSVAMLIAMTDVKDVFKDENGSTNWQYVANWSSGTLIIILAVVILNLFLAHRRIRKSNNQLNTIREELEIRVVERTASLDKTNTNLLDTNKQLEEEVTKHLTTTQRLLNSEYYIKNILASMPLVLVSLDEKGDITHWNEKAEELSGIAATSAIGNNLWQVYPEIVLSWEQVEKVMGDEETFTYPHRQRGIHYYDVTLYPLKGSKNKGVVILVNDVSKQKQAENMLVQNEKIASVTELASAMAHDINTPLQGMLLDLQSFQQLLSKHDNKPVVAQDVDKLNVLLSDASKRADTVASVVKNLLSFARGRSEQKQAEDVKQLLENSVTLAKDMLVLSGGLSFDDIDIVRDYQADLPLLNCYPTELQQVFLNIIRHACYALETKGDSEQQARINISVTLEADGLWICLSHNGATLNDEEQMSIFEPALSVIQPQRDVDTKKRLSFSHFIVTDQHQGQMAVTSDEENGTKFFIQLMLD